MSKERPQPQDVYGFTDREQLFGFITDRRFRAIVADEQTTVHQLKLTTNSYGEFVFVVTSRGAGTARTSVTFYGLGYHEYRERWLTDEWFWYHANAFPDVLIQQLSKAEVEELLRDRRGQMPPEASQPAQTTRGRLFEMLADLTDEDGALSELEDLGDWLDDWFPDE